MIPAGLYYGYWANVLYILGMFGYLTIDTLSYLVVTIDMRFSAFSYTFLAMIFVIDAILYTIDWYFYAVKSRENSNEPIQYRAEFVACIFHHIGSQCYFIGALLAFYKDSLIEEFLLLNFLGILALLFESGWTFIGWFIKSKRKGENASRYQCASQNVYLWAHVLNIVAATIYLCAATFAYRFYINYRIINPNGVLILHMLGDLIYLFDAYLYYDCWQRDKQEYEANHEQDQLIELRFAKQFTMDEIDPNTKTSE